MANQYEAARDIYAAWGVDTEEALRKMDTIPVSINCWQLDDLTGFEDFDAALTGGIAATGNAPCRGAHRPVVSAAENKAMSPFFFFFT